MIQRIQSIFIAICIIIFILFLFLPLKEVMVDGLVHPLTALSAVNSKFSYTETFSAVCSFIFLNLVLSIAAVLCYRQRYLQIRLCYITIFFSALNLVLLNFTHSVNAHSSGEMISLSANVMLGATIVFMILAVVFIKKDINLLKRADRIR